MNEHTADRRILQEIIADYTISRDLKGHAFVRYNAAGSTPGLLLPLPSHELTGELQERFVQKQQRPVSLLAIKDALALLKGRASRPDVNTAIVPVPAIMSLQSSYPTGSIAIRLPKGGCLWISRKDWDAVKPSEIEGKRQAVFIQQSGKPACKLAEIVENWLSNPANRPGINKGRPDPLKALSTVFEQDFPGLGQSERLLVMAWLLGVLTKAHMPMLVLTGPRGCGKTYLAKVLASLFSRSGRYNLNLPRLPVDIQKRLSDEIVVIFDNVRAIPETVSDELCRLITGGDMVGMSPQFSAYGHLDCARIIMTSIHNPIQFEDLASRALVVELLPKSGARKPNKSIPELHRDITICLLDSLGHAMNKVPPTGPVQALNNLSADVFHQYRFEPFLTHIIRIERSLPQTHSMAQAILQSVEDSDVTAADDEPLIILIKELLQKPPHHIIKTTANELIPMLRALERSKLWHRQPWLIHPRALSVALKNLRHTLAACGIGYTKTSAREHELVDLNAATKTQDVSQTTPAVQPALAA